MKFIKSRQLNVHECLPCLQPDVVRNIINYWCAPESSDWKGWGVGQAPASYWLIAMGFPSEFPDHAWGVLILVQIHI